MSYDDIARAFVCPSRKELADSAVLRTECPPEYTLHYRPGSPKHAAPTDMIWVFLTKKVFQSLARGRACCFNVFLLRPKPNGS